MSEMMKDAKRLREERYRTARQAQEIVALAQKEERSLTSDERLKFDQMMKACGELETRFTDLEKAASAVSDHDVAEMRQEHRDQQSREINRAGGIPLDVQERAQNAWFKRGTAGWNEKDEEAAKICGVDLRSKYFTIGMPNFRGQYPRSVEEFRRMQAEQAHLIRWHQPTHHITAGKGEDQAITRATTAQTLTTTGGGNVVQNQAMAAVQEAILSMGSMRKVATVIQTATGATWPIPTANENQAGVQVAINTAVDTLNTLWGQQTLGAKKFSSGQILVPIELMQDSTIDLPSYLGRVAGRRIARVTEQQWATGASSNSAMEGLVTTGSSGGATAATTLSSYNTVQYADLVSLIHYVDVELRNAKASQFMFHDSVLQSLRGLVDTTGRPLWIPSVASGAPDTILGYPYVINNAYTAFSGTSVGQAANDKIITFGPHSDYWIREVMGMSFMRLDERYAEIGQVGFLAFARYDGQYVSGVAGTTQASLRCAVTAGS